MITEPLTSPDHLEIRDVVRDFAASTFTSERVRAAAASALGYDEIAWKQMVGLGWAGLGIGVEAGGDDLGFVVRCIVHRELGARLAPTPYLASATFAAVALDELADPGLSLPVLTSIAAGTACCTLVLGYGRGWPLDDATGISASETDDGWVLEGTADLVLDGARADTLVVVAAIEGSDDWGVFAVRPGHDGVDNPAVATVDTTRSLADMRFNRAPADPLHLEVFGLDRVRTVVDRVAVCLAAEMVGAASSCMSQTLDYLRTRRQFNKPIGSFQALKHRCADMAVSVTTVEELVFAAAESADASNMAALSLAAPLALARAGEVLRHVTEEAIQMHGGVGFTDEVDIGLYYKRALGDLELVATPVDAFARMNGVRLGTSR